MFPKNFISVNIVNAQANGMFKTKLMSQEALLYTQPGISIKYSSKMYQTLSCSISIQ